MIELNKRKAEVVKEAIDYWSKNEIITPQEEKKLLDTLVIMGFDFKKLAKYSFWVSMICIVISISSVLFDTKLMLLIREIFNAPDSIKFISLTLITTGIYFYGLKRQASFPDLFYRNEAILFIGNLFAAGALFFLFKLIDWSQLDPVSKSDFLLLCTIIYGFLAYISRSKITWIIAILILATFYELKVFYSYGGYFLSIAKPLQFLLFAVFILILGLVMEYSNKLIIFKHTTYKMGLLFVFITLWILSIFGDYSDLNTWHNAKQIELFHWSLLFALASIIAIYGGIKYDDNASRGFGLTFLFINLYTRFFEYFWNASHKAIFFFILGISFWLLGSKSERIWNIGKNRDIAQIN